MPRLDEREEPFVYPNVIPDDSVPDVPVVDPDAPRMLLKGFEIHGVIERPELDITLERIKQIIKIESDKMVPEGSKRLFTIGMFEKIAVSISRYYRSKGFFLARTLIPEQTVSDGIVKILVIESTLEQVVLENNRLYSDKQLTRPLEALVGESIFKEDVESVLFAINDYPGLSVNAIFGPGTKQGTAAIVMRTQEDNATGLVTFDNHGSAFTGENRLRLKYDVNNLLGMADVLSFTGLVTTSPQNSIYGEVFYQQPILNLKYKVGGGIKLNLFDVGQELEDLGINGETLVINTFGEYQFFRTRADQLKTIVDLSLKSATSKVLSTVDSEDKLTVIKVDAIYSGIDRWLWRANHEASVSISVGLADFLGSMDSNGNGKSGRRGKNGVRASGDFTKLQLGYIRLQPLNSLQSVLFRLRTQHSSDLLTSLEQVALGGPDSVRAYPVAESLMDNVLFTSFEWVVKASPAFKQTWLNKLQLSAFFDYAKGSLNDPLVNEVASVTLGGIGVSAQVEPFNRFKARIDFATPAGGDKPSDVQTLPFYFSVAYDF